MYMVLYILSFFRGLYTFIKKRKKENNFNIVGFVVTLGFIEWVLFFRRFFIMRVFFLFMSHNFFPFD